MKIDFDICNAKFVKYAKRIFIDNDLNLFNNSVFLKSLSFLNNSKISFVCLLISITCYWYEVFFTSIGIGLVERFNFAAIFLILALLFCDKKRIKSSMSIRFLMVFSVVLVLSGIAAALNGLVLGMLVNGIMIFCQFIFAFVIALTYKNKRILLDSFLTLSLPMILLGLYQGLAGPKTSRLWVSASESLVDNRAFGFFGSPNILGSVLMLTIIISVFSWFKYRRWFYIGYMALASVVLYFTFSRSAWIGLLTGLGVAIIIKDWRLIKFAPLALLFLLVPSIRQRLSVMVSQQYLVDAAIDGRVWSINNSIEIFKTSPIIGTGPGSYGGETALYYDSPVYLKSMQNGYVALPYTDSQWMQILTQTGVIGAISLGCFFVSAFMNCLIAYIKSKDYLLLGVLAAIVAVVVNGAFANIWEFGAVSVLSGAYLGLGAGDEK